MGRIARVGIDDYWTLLSLWISRGPLPGSFYTKNKTTKSEKKTNKREKEEKKKKKKIEAEILKSRKKKKRKKLGERESEDVVFPDAYAV